MFGLGNTTLIISNKEMNNIMKIAKSVEDFGLLIKGVSETIQNQAKEKKRRISQYVIRCFRCYFITKSINK